MRFVLAILIAAAACGAQSFHFQVAAEELLQQRLRLAHPNNAERYERLKALFAECGCKGDTFLEQRVKGSKEPNMICGIAGTGERPRKIIVGAHFDAAGGDGVIDNWSGAVLLPSLFELLSRGQHRHTFEFVAFAAEEKGLLGSQAYLKSSPKKDRGGIAAVLAMDSLGLTPTKCWANGSSKELVNAAAGVAAALKLDFAGVNVERIGTTDSQPFFAAKIPVLSLHSVTQQTWQITNSDRDVWAAVSWKDYYDSHRLVSALLAYLDQTLP